MKTYLLIFFIWLGHFSFSFAQTEAFPTDQNSTQIYENTESGRSQPTPIDPNDPFRNLHDDLEKEPDNFQAKFFNMLFVLFLLIGFMLLASWMLKRMTRTKVSQMNNASSIKVLETRYLSPKLTLYLLDILGQGVVIAETHAGASPITSISLTEENSQPPLAPFEGKKPFEKI